jgi:hypothetical protein
LKENLDDILRNSSKISLNSNYNTTNFDKKFIFFLKAHGERVVDLSHAYLDDFNITKFLPFMPNLETVVFNSSPDVMPILNRYEKHSVKIKKLYVYRENIRTWSTMQVFDVEELEFDTMFSSPNQKCLDFITNCKTLKHFKCGSVSGKPEVLKVLATLNLESLQLRLFHLQEEDLVQFFEALGKKPLKTLKVEYVKSRVLSAICENMVNLESISLGLYDPFDGSDFMKIANLKSLKSLTLLGDKYLTSRHIMDMSSFALDHLESLKIETKAKISFDSVQSLANNFKTLKSLNLKLTWSCFHMLLTKILKCFNKIESLSVKCHNDYNKKHQVEVNDKFYELNHSNPKLKSLKLPVCGFDPRKLLQKITRDFPNLEDYPDCYLSEHHQLLDEIGVKPKKDDDEKLKVDIMHVS